MGSILPVVAVGLEADHRWDIVKGNDSHPHIGVVGQVLDRGKESVKIRGGDIVDGSNPHGVGLGVS